jgi:hypothetical protein
MRGFIRKARTGVAVALAVVVGGGFATAAGYDPASTSHDVTYEVLSFRAISLSSTAPVPIGYVRQGSYQTVSGPSVLYATTWTGDRIVVSLDSDVATDLILRLKPGAPSVAPSYYPTPVISGTPSPVPTQYAVPCDPGGSGAPVSSVPLTAGTAPLIESITDCGLDTSGAWVTSTTTFTLDATGANDPDTDYTGSTTKTVTYTIEGTA